MDQPVFEGEAVEEPLGEVVEQGELEQGGTNEKESARGRLLGF